MKFSCHDIPGYETEYVECYCEEDKRENLLQELQTLDAIKVKLHQDKKGSN